MLNGFLYLYAGSVDQNVELAVLFLYCGKNATGTFLAADIQSDKVTTVVAVYLQ